MRSTHKRKDFSVEVDAHCVDTLKNKKGENVEVSGKSEQGSFAT